MIQATPIRLDIPRGGRFSQQFRLTQGATSLPLDLTGLGPFTCHVRSEPGAQLLLELNVAETDLPDGRLTLTAEKEATAEVASGFTRARFDVIDAEGTPWLSGIAYLSETISELP
jgi:hypothetical protein